MPVQRCSLGSGRKGWKWGSQGKCYASREDAIKQMQAILASGYKENSERAVVALESGGRTLSEARTESHSDGPLTINKKKPRKVRNPLRTDPSRTATLRRLFENELKRRFKRVMKDVEDLILVEDAFGLIRESTLNAYNPNQPRDARGRWGSGGGGSASQGPVFKAWFRDSKVVDEDGNPLVVYHGTEAEFEEVDAPSFFTEEPAEASAYASITDYSHDVKIKYEPASKHSIPGGFDPYDTWSSYQDYEGPPNVVAANGNTNRLFYWDGSTNDYGDKNIVILSGVQLDDSPPAVRVTSTPGRLPMSRVIYKPTVDDEGRAERAVPGRVYPAYLSIQNPVELPWNEANILGKRLGAKDADIQKTIAGYIAKGYDGISTYSDEGIQIGRKIRQFIPFSKSQILPAIGNPTVNTLVVNARWIFHTKAQQVAAFLQWLKEKFKVELFNGIKGLEQQAMERMYWEKFVEEAYKKGQGRAFDDVRKPAMAEDGSWYAGTKDEFLKSAFGRPMSVEKVKLMAGRVFTDLKGVTEAVATVISRDMTEGFARGENPHVIAKKLKEDIGVGSTRAATIARTEVIRAHAEGQLDAMERLGVEEVGVMVEWDTAGDGRVCGLCSAMDGAVFSIKEARGMIPRHPNCRCVHLPSNVGESAGKQKRGQEKVKDAVEESITLEGKKNETLEETKARVKWVGADKNISKVRSESVLDSKVQVTKAINRLNTKIDMFDKIASLKKEIDGRYKTSDDMLKQMMDARYEDKDKDLWAKLRAERGEYDAQTQDMAQEILRLDAEALKLGLLDVNTGGTVTPTQSATSKPSDKFVRKVAESLNRIPEKLGDHLHAEGVRVVTSETVTGHYPDLVGQKPRGWEFGGTWDNADGLYRRSDKAALVTEYMISGASGAKEPSRRTGAVIRHEYGHAVDDQMAVGRLSERPAFREAWEKDIEELLAKTGSHIKPGEAYLHAEAAELAYLIQADATAGKATEAGASEAFAEAFAELVGGGCEGAELMVRNFPRAIASVAKIVEAYL